ncbi:MAG: aldo/keto reductase [Candidatus Paralactobacillus gallistercoris]|uniref:Aldo/keto reductase n=1 Tax=Candidatus Paralactobacillus gallistercoris TaxID=2838724 RepID=A0A948TIK1_9LACO|nr:aldo/keto reductase [Candidatus Paralactobacillus gallistercoris]
MQEVTIGKSDVKATPLGFGTNAVGGWNLFPNLNDENGKELVRTALDSGITFIDTAFAYGLGHSEELVGEAIQGYDRSKFVIADKAAQDFSSGEKVIRNDPQFLREAVDKALLRLKTDYIDIFYIHHPDANTPKDEAVEALNEIKKTGKIRAIGVSNFSLAQLEEANRYEHVDIIQNEYSLIHPYGQNDLLPYAHAHHISLCPFFTLASGLLTGKYDHTVSFPAGDIRHSNPDFNEPRFTKIIDTVNQLKPLAAKYHITVTQLVLAFYIADPDVTIALPGAKRVDQVISNAKAMDVNLTTTDYQFIKNLFKPFFEEI